MGGRILLHCKISYSTTSSARTRNVSGIVRPSALAVIMFTTRSNWTGWLDRDVPRLRSAQNLVHVVGGPPVEVLEVWSIRHQTPDSTYSRKACIVGSRAPSAWR